jgi:hypothetical protein
MSVYPWRKRETRHFGAMYRPSVDLQLLAKDGKWLTLQCELDSGAVITLLPRSIAGVLGINLVDGRAIELSSVGGQKITAHVHSVQAKIGLFDHISVPVAIADSDDVPHLLGWLGIFDTYRVDFDPVAQTTRITEGLNTK